MTWLDPPVAASRPTRAATSGDAGNDGVHRAPGRHLDLVHAHGEHREGGQEDDDPAAVRSRLAPADGDEREHEDAAAPPAGRAAPPPASETVEQDGLDQVPGPVEAASAVGPRADRREGVHLRPGGEHDQVGGDERDERPREEPGRDGDEQAAADRQRGEQRDDEPGSGDCERRQHERAREDRRRGEQAGSPEVT